MRIICEACGGAEATVDHLDLTLAEGQLKRLCTTCGDQEKRRWDRERLRRPMAAPISSPRPA